MAAHQGIKRRIKSVSNTKQITKAMQLVAASKLRRAQDAAIGPKQYIAAAQEILLALASTPEAQYHPLFEQRAQKSVLTVAITSDRGLAGAYNSNINKALTRHAQEIAANKHSVIAVGNYAARHVARVVELDELAAYAMDSTNPDVEIAQPILREAIDLFIAGEIDAVYVIYTKFISTVRQEVATEQLLPIAAPETSSTVSRTYEPEIEALLDFAIKRLLEAQVLQAVLESGASEQAARMMAMKNATDNASDLIEDLTLAFNNARQAAITQELAEITAGAEAING